MMGVMDTHWKEALQQAISIAGSQSALAALLETKQPRVSNWLNRDKNLTPDIAIKIERATGVSKQKLCPNFPWGAA